MNKKELKLILEEGEGYKIEFKESLSNFDKELVAFSNSSGGRIFLGISDNGAIKGIQINNKLKSQVQDIANNCQPAIKIFFEELKNILIINIREGEDKPYKCSSGFYTRVGPNSQKLNRNEIIEIFKSEGKIRFDELVNQKRFDYNTHFDERKLENFLKLAGISKVLDTPAILKNLGIAEKQDGEILLNNTGILFFSKNLQDIYFHTTVTCALYKGIEKIDILDRRDFNEDIVSNIDRTMNFLKQSIPVRYKMTGNPRRQEIPEIPYEALREAVINAVTHRDYFEKGANVMVEMFDDRIEITNPGGLIKGLSPEDFGKKSVLRNPNIANLLLRIGYIEKMGTGINKMRKVIQEAGLKELKFEFGTFFTVIFTRPGAENISIIGDDAINDAVNDAINGRLFEECIYTYQNKFLNMSVMKDTFKISRATAQRDMTQLKKLGIIEFDGPPKTGKYILTDKGKKIVEKINKNRESKN